MERGVVPAPGFPHCRIAALGEPDPCPRREQSRVVSDGSSARHSAVNTVQEGGSYASRTRWPLLLVIFSFGTRDGLSLCVLPALHLWRFALGYRSLVRSLLLYILIFPSWSSMVFSLDRVIHSTAMSCPNTG